MGLCGMAETSENKLTSVDSFRLSLQIPPNDIKDIMVLFFAANGKPPVKCP